MTDPMQDRNNDDERHAHELAQLDAQLDDEQARLHHLAHEDPGGLVWFGEDDDWLDKRLKNQGGGSVS